MLQSVGKVNSGETSWWTQMRKGIAWSAFQTVQKWPFSTSFEKKNVLLRSRR